MRPTSSMSARSAACGHERGLREERPSRRVAAHVVDVAVADDDPAHALGGQADALAVGQPGSRPACASTPVSTSSARVRTDDEVAGHDSARPTAPRCDAVPGRARGRRPSMPLTSPRTAARASRRRRRCPRGCRRSSCSTCRGRSPRPGPARRCCPGDCRMRCLAACTAMGGLAAMPIGDGARARLDLVVRRRRPGRGRPGGPPRP